jgi:uncharacterized membrane protein
MFMNYFKNCPLKAEYSWLLYLFLAFFGVLYFTMVFCNHYFFRTYCFDYGSYNFAFYDFAHFRVSDSPVFPPHINFLQDHVSFTLILFIPLYWTLGWLTGTYTLSVIQTFIILFGGWAVYKLIELKTSSKLLSVLALLQYFTLYGRWASFCPACNLAIIASSIVPVFLYYFEKKNFSSALMFLVFILLTREDMALWTFFIGVFLLFSHLKDKKYRMGSLIVILLSLAYFIFTFKFIIPHLETQYKKFSLFNYSALGKDPSEALCFIIAHPFKTIKLLFLNHSGIHSYDVTKFEFYYVYFLCGGFLLLYRPKYLILFIPLIAKKMFNDDPIRWSIESYYSIEIVSTLPIAVFLIISEFSSRKVKNILIVVVCFNSLAVTTFKLLEKGRRLNCDNTNFAFYRSTMYTSGFDVKKVYRHLELIPSDAKVTASVTILPHLAFRPNIYNFPKVEDANYIVVFRDRDTYPLGLAQFDKEIDKYLSDSSWNIKIDDYPLLILKKEKKQKIFKDEAFVKIEKYYCDAESLTTDKKSFTSTSGLIFSSGNLQSDEKAHNGKYSIKLTKEAHYGMTVKIKGIKVREKFGISVWRLANDNNATIIASSTSDNKFYNGETVVVKKDEKGWELIQKAFVVPFELPDNELAIYLWNNSDQPVYFDDLQISREIKLLNQH